VLVMRHTGLWSVKLIVKDSRQSRLAVIARANRVACFALSRLLKNV
jgi:hypothetical protein